MLGGAQTQVAEATSQPISSEEVVIAADYYRCLSSTKAAVASTCSSCLIRSSSGSGAGGLLLLGAHLATAGHSKSATSQPDRREGQPRVRNFKMAMQQCFKCVTAVQGAFIGRACRACWLPDGSRGRRASSGQECQQCLEKTYAENPDASGETCAL